MHKQNITLKVPVEALKKAKIAAARRGTSLSALLIERLEEAVGQDAAYDSAQKRAAKWLDSGWHLGGRPAPRDGVHG